MMSEDLSMYSTDIEWMYDASTGEHRGYCSVPYVIVSIKAQYGLFRLKVEDESPDSLLHISIIVESYDACTSLAKMFLSHILEMKKLVRSRDESSSESISCDQKS